MGQRHNNDARRGIAWLGLAQRGRARQGKDALIDCSTGQGAAGRSKAPCGNARHGKARYMTQSFVNYEAVRGLAVPGRVRPRVARQGKVFLTRRA